MSKTSNEGRSQTKGKVRLQRAKNVNDQVCNLYCSRDPWENCSVITSVSVCLSLSLSLLPASPIGQPRHSHQCAAEALTSVGSRGTLIIGQPRHSHLSQAILPQRGIAILGVCVFECGWGAVDEWPNLATMERQFCQKPWRTVPRRRAE